VEGIGEIKLGRFTHFVFVLHGLESGFGFGHLTRGAGVGERAGSDYGADSDHGKKFHRDSKEKVWVNFDRAQSTAPH
jgi:hypothetical protein